MGTTKTSLFTEEQNQISAIAKALGHPARIAILQHLLHSKRCINNDLVGELGLAQATVSQHLAALKAIGIIQGSIEGAAMSYCINKEAWLESRAGLLSLLDVEPNNLSKDCC